MRGLWKEIDHSWSEKTVIQFELKPIATVRVPGVKKGHRLWPQRGSCGALQMCKLGGAVRMRSIRQNLGAMTTAETRLQSPELELSVKSANAIRARTLQRRPTLSMRAWVLRSNKQHKFEVESKSCHISEFPPSPLRHETRRCSPLPGHRAPGMELRRRIADWAGRGSEQQQIDGAGRGGSVVCGRESKKSVTDVRGLNRPGGQGIARFEIDRRGREDRRDDGRRRRTTASVG
jgi:hypothetical protein